MDDQSRAAFDVRDERMHAHGAAKFATSIFWARSPSGATAAVQVVFPGEVRCTTASEVKIEKSKYPCPADE